MQKNTSTSDGSVAMGDMSWTATVPFSVTVGNKTVGFRVIVVDGEFARCTYNIAGMYDLDEWKIIGIASKVIDDVMHEVRAAFNLAHGIANE